jgi:hypothetical protein
VRKAARRSSAGGRTITLGSALAVRFTSLYPNTVSNYLQTSHSSCTSPLLALFANLNVQRYLSDLLALNGVHGVSFAFGGNLSYNAIEEVYV